MMIFHTQHNIDHPSPKFLPKAIQLKSLNFWTTAEAQISILLIYDKVAKSEGPICNFLRTSQKTYPLTCKVDIHLKTKN